MNGNCFDIGQIQAFLDGELSHEESAAVSSHAAVCDACAFEISRAENESAMVFAALEREFDKPVITHLNGAVRALLKELDNWRPFPKGNGRVLEAE